MFYCAMGNEPVMEVTSTPAGEKSIRLDLSSDSKFDWAKEDHMHSLEINWQDDNHVIEKWTMYQGGKEAGTSVFDLQRK